MMAGKWPCPWGSHGDSTFLPHKPRHRGVAASMHQASLPAKPPTNTRVLLDVVAMLFRKAFSPRLRSAVNPRQQSFPLRYSPPSRRHLHLAPPFLLDDYIPQYQLLSSVDAAKKRSLAYAHLRECNLCPRLCGVNRYEKTGVCLIGSDVKVNTIAPHFGEGTM